jgi:hypothetical protein
MLKSWQIRFDAEEDRLLMVLLAADAAGQELRYQLAVTRRVCSQWLGQLRTLVQWSAQVPPQASAMQQQHIAQTHHQALAKQATFTKSPNPSATAAAPASATWLVTRIVCGQRKDDGRWALRFESREGEPLDLTLSSPTLHGTIELLRRQLALSQWGLAALPELQADTPPAGGAANANNLLH